MVLGAVCSPQETHNVMAWASGDKKLVLYADDCWIAGRNHEWFQYALTVIVTMFCRMGLDTNLNKTNAMVCNLGII